MAKRGEKRRRSELDVTEPVAKRTRLMCGTPLRRTVPVQYPRQWVSRDCLSNAHVTNVNKRLCDRSGRNDIDLPSTSKAIHVDRGRSSRNTIDLPSTSKAAHAARHHSSSKGASNNKQLKRSFIQCVTVRSAKDQVKGSRKARSRRAPVKRRRTARGRRKGRKVYRRKLKGRRRARRKGQVHRKRQVRRKRKPTTAPRRTRRVPKRLLKRAQELEKRKPAFKQAPPLGHEMDDILCKHNKNTTRNIEIGRGEILEDPLNVRNICRNLVKSMQGMPADHRTYKENDDKANQQDSKDQHKEDEEKKNRVNKRRYKKSRNVARNRRKPHCKHLKGHHRKSSVTKKQRHERLNSRRHKKIVNKRIKRKIVDKGKKLTLRQAPKCRQHTKGPSRAKVVQMRQKSSRSAEVSRRRMTAGKSRHQ